MSPRESRARPRQLPVADPPVVTQRLAALDAVRVVGIIAIVAGHVWSTGTTAQLFYAWHVPVFFFLTGWLWKGHRTFRAEVHSRTRTLLVPYLSWLVLIGLSYLPVLARDGGSVQSQLRFMVYGGRYLVRPFTAFWFVTALFALCLLRRALERWGLRVATAVAVVLAVASYPVSELLSRTPESVGMALPALVFLVAGEWSRRWRPRIPAPRVVGPLLIIVPLALVAAGIVRAVNLKVGDLGTPVAGYLVALAISLGLVVTAQELESYASPALRRGVLRLASVGLAVILSHTMLLWLFDTPTDGRALDFLPVLVIAWAVALAVSATPASRLLIGWPAKDTVASPREPAPSPGPGQSA